MRESTTACHPDARYSAEQNQWPIPCSNARHETNCWGERDREERSTHLWLLRTPYWNIHHAIATNRPTGSQATSSTSRAMPPKSPLRFRFDASSAFPEPTRHETMLRRTETSTATPATFTFVLLTGLFFPEGDGVGGGRTYRCSSSESFASDNADDASSSNLRTGSDRALNLCPVDDVLSWPFAPGERDPPCAGCGAFVNDAFTYTRRALSMNNASRVNTMRGT